MFSRHIFDTRINIVYTNDIRGIDMETTVVKWGNSQGIRLNKELLEQAKIHVNDKVIIELTEDNNLLIKKCRPSIKELMSNYKGDIKIEEYDFGEPKGREIW